MRKLSVAIIARNEERHIGGCLESVRDLADEVVVVLDAQSYDRTASICDEHHARIIRTHTNNFAALRNEALAACQGEWVLFLDADERLLPPLRDEIRQCITTTKHDQESGLPVVGYWIPRYNLFFGGVVRGGGWYPDHQLRLLRRDAAHYDERLLVHEYPMLDGASNTVAEHILHYNIEYLGEFWRKQCRYALAEARILARDGRHTRCRNFVGAPLREFWRRYIRLGGWRDGWRGLFLCGSLAWFQLVTYACLLLLSETSRPLQTEYATPSESTRHLQR